MKKLSVVIAVPVLLVAFAMSVFAQTNTAERPRILGIDHVSFYTTAPDGVKKLYGDVLGLTSAAPVEAGGTLRYLVGRQWVGYSAAPAAQVKDRMDHVAFATDNIVALRRDLISNGIKPVEGRVGSSHS